MLVETVIIGALILSRSVLLYFNWFIRGPKNKITLGNLLHAMGADPCSFSATSGFTHSPSSGLRPQIVYIFLLKHHEFLSLGCISNFRLTYVYPQFDRYYRAFLNKN